MWSLLSSEHQLCFILHLPHSGVPGQEGSAEEDKAQGNFPSRASGYFCVMDAEVRTNAVRIASLSCYSKTYKLSSLLCEQHAQKITSCCEILVHQFGVLLCPARALPLVRATQSPPDRAAGEGSSSHQCKINTCLQYEPPNQHPAHSQNKVIFCISAGVSSTKKKSPVLLKDGRLSQTASTPVRANASSFIPQASVSPDLSIPISPFF